MKINCAESVLVLVSILPGLFEDQEEGGDEEEWLNEKIV